MMERVALSAGRCGSECVEYSILQNMAIKKMEHKDIFVKNVVNALQL